MNWFGENSLRVVVSLLLLVGPALGQGKRLWVLRSPGEMVEYDPATFAVKQTVKVPAEAVQAPANVSVNRLGQILFGSTSKKRLRRRARCGFGMDTARIRLIRE